MATTTGDTLKFQISADATKAKAVLNDLDKQIGKLGGQNSLGSIASNAQKEWGSLGSVMGKATSALGSIPVPAAAAAAAIAGVAAAVVGLGNELFSLAKDAAAIGRSFASLEGKTGLSATAVSTLALACAQSGKELTDIQRPLVAFNELLVKAQKEGSAESELLRRLGITDLKNLDGALDQATTALNSMSGGQAKLHVATELFGKRSGPEMIGILKKMPDGFRAAQREAEKLGFTLSENDIKAAKEFGLAYDTVAQQVKIATAKFALAYAPQITGAIKDISKWLSTNKDNFAVWGGTAGIAIREVLTGIKNIAQFIADHPIILKIATFGNPAINYALDHPEEVRQQVMQPPAGSPQIGSPDATDLDTDAIDNARQAAEKRAQERERAFQQELSARAKYNSLKLAGERAAYSDYTRQLETEFLNGERTAEVYRDNALRNLGVYENNVKKLLSESARLSSRGKKGTDLAAVQLENQQALDALARESAGEREDVEKNITEAAQKQETKRVSNAKQESEDLIALTRAKAETQLAILDQQLQLGLVKEKNYARKIGQLHLDTLEAERRQETDLNRQKVLDEAIATQKIRNAILVTEAINKETAALDKQAQAMQTVREHLHKIVEDLKEMDRKDKENSPIGQLKKRWDELRESMEGVVGMKNVLAGFGNIAMDAINNMTNALESSIEAYVLYGDSIGAALKKALAAELAHIAGVATVRALYATALGFMRLAEYDFAGAANAFTSAALWAALAVGAAVAGRALSGGGDKKDAKNNNGQKQGADQNSGTYSRSSEKAYDSGNRGDGIHRLIAAIERLHHKIDTAKPGDVLVRGMQQRPGAVGQQVSHDIGRNAGIGREIMRKSGMS